MRKIWLLLFAGIGLLLAACDRFSTPQTVTLAGYRVSLSHQPDPLQVGFIAELQVRISDNQNQEKRDCATRFRRFMPAMEMAQDHDMVVMPVDDTGSYRAKTRSFSMAGEWVLEITIDCGAGPASYPFSYQLEWPE